MITELDVATAVANGTLPSPYYNADYVLLRISGTGAAYRPRSKELVNLPSIRHLEMVRVLAQHRHFGRAASNLGISQPSLTRTIKHLEEMLGVPLFDRADGVTPTLVGRIVLETGEMLLIGFAELAREITLAKGLEIGELTIAIGPYPAEISGQKAVGQLTARYPGLVIQLRTTDWTSVVGDVLEGRADLVSRIFPRPWLIRISKRNSFERQFCVSFVVPTIHSQVVQSLSLMI